MIWCNEAQCIVYKVYYTLYIVINTVLGSYETICSTAALWQYSLSSNSNLYRLCDNTLESELLFTTFSIAEHPVTGTQAEHSDFICSYIWIFTPRHPLNLPLLILNLKQSEHTHTSSEPEKHPHSYSPQNHPHPSVSCLGVAFSLVRF